MGGIVEIPSIKPRLVRRHQGLHKLSPDLISKARDETATQVTRLGLTFLGTTAFCLLSLESPDIALLSGSEKINVPFAGPVSFIGFMLLGPALLIMLRVYLQIYVEHGDKLDRLARSVSAVRAPTLVPLHNSLIRLFSGLIFYVLLPVAMMLFAWKAAVFPVWGSGVFGVAVTVIASHAMLLSGRFSWRSKGLLSVSAGITGAIIAGVGMLGFGWHRGFDLSHANLSGQWLLGEVLRKTDLSYANLSGSDLHGVDLLRANLSGANLRGANLSGGADLSGADLSRANLSDANLSIANLLAANLSDAILSGAHLNRAKLYGTNLSGSDLHDVDLFRANLSGANLSYANLSGAILSDANLIIANLSRAKLVGADLSGADLSRANLSRANLSDANLIEAKNLTQTQLDKACGNANTNLPEGLTLKPCSTD
jgi:uncharacterized protein YjbI with pentapeptide repeats